MYASPKAGEENGSAIRGSFKTGIDGDAFVVANGTGITDETNQDAWSGVIFDGDGDGKVTETRRLKRMQKFRLVKN